MDVHRIVKVFGNLSPTALRTRITLCCTLAFFALPVVVDLAISGKRRPFAYLASDAFYYLTVSRNIAEKGLVSFDGEHRTNGFHPFWQFLEGLIWGLAKLFGTSTPVILALVVLLNVVLLSIGLLCLGLALRRKDGSLSPLLLTLPIGAYGIGIWPLWLLFDPEALARQNGMEGSEPVFGTLWSYANGMESSLTICLFGVVALYFVRQPILQSYKHAAIFGAVLAALSLARLDHIVFAMAMAACLLWRSISARDLPRLKRALAVTLAFVLPILAFMIVSKVVFGHAIPTSGKVKSAFPHITTSNLDELLSVWRDRSSRPGGWLSRSWRVVQLVVPIVTAAIYPLFVVWARWTRLGVVLRCREPAFERFLLLMAPGVIWLGLYNFFFVYFYSQGHWYFPISTLFVSLVFVVQLDRIRPLSRSTTSRVGIGAWLVLSGAAVVGGFVAMQRRSDYHERLADFFFEEVPKLDAYYGRHRPRLVERDDSIVAFATGYPTINGMGLTLDKDALRAYKKDQLGELAVQRGFNRFTSLVYHDFGSLQRTSSPEDVKQWMKQNRLARFKDLDRFRFSVEYRSDKTGFGIIRADPIPSKIAPSTPAATRKP
jgi:hypothetical protein